MPKKKSDLSQYTANARRNRRYRLLKMSESPEMKAERLKKVAEAYRAKRSAETPEQRESRVSYIRIRENKRRALKLATFVSKQSKAIIEGIKKSDKIARETLKQQEKDEIRQIEDAERHLARGFKELAKLEKTLYRTRSNGNNTNDFDESATLNTLVDLCKVELMTGSET